MLMYVSFPSDTWAPVALTTYLPSVVFCVLVSSSLDSFNFCLMRAMSFSVDKRYFMVRQTSETKRLFAKCKSGLNVE